jgi:hypothetical protein
VTDAASGRPIDAEVVVREHHDPRVGPRRTHPEDGTFLRLLRPGEVTVTVSAAGRTAVTRRLRIAPSGWTRMDVELD